MAHLGGLPYAVGTLGLNVPVYATLPVYNMGLLTCYDAYLAKDAVSDFGVYTLDHVDAAFDLVVRLKYTQHVVLPGSGSMASSSGPGLGGGAITVTPYAAGHTLGGAVWKITKGTDEVLYAVNYNHRKERHLDETLLETLTRPSLLISNASGFTHKPAMKRKARDKALVSQTLDTLRSGGNVLIPTDTSLRVLELVLFLSQLWQSQKLTQYGLVLYSHSAYSVAQEARSQLEWMSDKLQNSFDEARTNPFDLHYVRIAHEAEDLEDVPRPFVVLASHESLEMGPARDLFVQMAPNPANSIIFPIKPPAGSLGAALVGPSGPPASVNMHLNRRVPLQGEELQRALAVREREREEKSVADAAAAAAMTNPEEALPDQMNDMMIESDDETSAAASGPTASLSTFDLMVNRERQSGRSAGGVSYFKQSQSYPMFPYRPPKETEVGPFGAIVDTSVYALGELETHTSGSYAFANASGSGVAPAGGMATGSEAHAGSMEAPVSNAMAMEMEDPLEARLPSKCMSWDVDVAVQAKILSLDYQGLSDGLSMKKILEHVAPRRLVVVDGSPGETAAMVEYCRAAGIAKEGVVAPEVGTSVDLSSQASVYHIKLKDAMTSSLHFTDIDDYKVAYFDGMVTYPPDAGNIPVLEPSETAPGHDPIFVGDVQSSTLRQVLLDAGLRVERSVDGVLVCNDKVGIRKLESGSLSIEGLPCEEYYLVREIVFSQFNSF